MYSKLFEEREVKHLYPTLIAGVAKTREKLLLYAEKHLPGGEYWNPEPAVRNFLNL